MSLVRCATFCAALLLALSGCENERPAIRVEKPHDDVGETDLVRRGDLNDPGANTSTGRPRSEDGQRPYRHEIGEVSIDKDRTLPPREHRETPAPKKDAPSPAKSSDQK